MSDPSAFGFGQFVPGFDFLQNLSKNTSQAQPSAAAGMPGMASWVAPTLNIEDIDKRIQELKSVLFWLEQNTTALKATIQAMEVQKMTLTTLQSMNVNMADLAKAFTAKPPVSAAAPEPVAEPEPATPFASSEKADAGTAKAATEEATEAATESATEAAKPAVDPMQWWGALTQQFQGIATAALKDVAGEAKKAGSVARSAKTSAARKATPGKTATGQTGKTRAAQAAGARKSATAKPASAVKPAKAQTARKVSPSATPRKASKK